MSERTDLVWAALQAQPRFDPELARKLRDTEYVRPWDDPYTRAIRIDVYNRPAARDLKRIGYQVQAYLSASPLRRAWARYQLRRLR